MFTKEEEIWNMYFCAALEGMALETYFPSDAVTHAAAIATLGTCRFRERFGDV